MTEATVKKEEIGYAYQFAADLGNGRQVNITGNLPKYADGTVINSELDKVYASFNRLQAKAALKSVEDEIEQTELRLADAKKDLERLDARAPAGKQLSGHEKQSREAAVVHIEKMQENWDYKKRYLERLKEEAK